MKREKWITGGIAAALAFLISFGAVGCMITGFDLKIGNTANMVLICGTVSLFCAGAFSLKWGGTLVLCVLALLTGYLWRRGEAAEQIFQLLYRITHFYNQAYGCGVFKLVDTPWDAGTAEVPTGIIGAFVSIAVSGTVCRGKSSILAVFLSLLPLFSCLVVTDTVPSEGYLFALLLGLILLILTSRVRKNNAAQGNRLTVMAFLPAALALATLFLAVPQESYVNQSKEIQREILAWIEGIPQSVETAVQGITLSVPSSEPESVNLSTLGRRIESTVPVMEVTADVSGTLYLRGQDYDSYDGAGWTASPHRVEDFSYEGIDLGDVVIRTRSKLDQLYLPYYPKGGISLVGGKIENTRLDTEYTVGRIGLPDGWQETANSVDESYSNLVFPVGEIKSVQDLRRYLTLPNATQSRAEALLETILSGNENTVEAAEKIAAFVRSSADYDLNTSRMPSGEEDFALWFLEESETGYCVHFATAAAVLLRAADIEARYVSGYLVRAQTGQTVTVTGENAHAWAEYYVPALDTWVVLEATPADVSEEPEGTPATEGTAAPSTETRPQPTQPSNTMPTETASAETKAPQQAETPGLPSSFVNVLLLAALAVWGAVSQRTLRIRLRRQRQRTGSPNAQALARWQEAELLAKLLQQQPPEELELLAQKAKFSQHTLTQEELTQFENYLRTARAQLREMPWYLRWVHQYIFAAY